MLKIKSKRRKLAQEKARLQLENSLPPPITPVELQEEDDTNKDYDDVDSDTSQNTSTHASASHDTLIDISHTKNSTDSDSSDCEDDNTHVEVPVQKPSTETSSVKLTKETRSRNSLFHAFTTTLKAMNLKNHRVLFDSGASTSATSDPSIIDSINYSEGVKAYPAFGPPVTTSASGTYGSMELDMLLLNGMPETLLSVSNICQGGRTKKQNVCVFTSEGVRVFTWESMRRILQLIDQYGIEVMRGYISNGVYTLNKPVPNTSRSSSLKSNNPSPVLFLAQFKPVSLYDHIHLVTGHPGRDGMRWHFNNSLNAKYTTADANKQRGVCKGCTYGTMTQTPTDHRRQHRRRPLRPGQCFVLDAYSHSVISSRGYKYCDLYTDLCTHRTYCVFTKNRSAHELCQQSRILFMKHPEWAALDDNDTRRVIQLDDVEMRRFIRLDSESSYRSIEFLAFVSALGYTLERTPVRDKHAGGIAERAVGVVVAKTNVAMLSPNTPVPQAFWDWAMTYATDTLSYNFNSTIGTSPYTMITGKPVNIKYLVPFFASCYVFIPLIERIKLGVKRAYKAKLLGYSNTSLLFPNYVVIPFENGHYGKIKDSKDVIFDPTIDFSVYTENEEPHDREFLDPDHYVPFLHRDTAPIELKGPTVTPIIPIMEDTFAPDFPLRSQTLAPPSEKTTPIPYESNTDDNINIVNMPYEDDKGEPVYWYSFFVRNDEYPRHMCESQHFSKLGVPIDSRIPRSFSKAVLIPVWKEAIDKE